MRKALTLIIVCTMTLVLLSGCAVVSSRRIRVKDHETHRFAIFEIPLWESQKPVEHVVEEKQHHE